MFLFLIESEEIKDEENKCNILESDNSTYDDMMPPCKISKIEKRKEPNKKNSIEILTTKLVEQSAVKEEARERRHIENLEMRRTSIQIFKETMDALLKKF